MFQLCLSYVENVHGFQAAYSILAFQRRILYFAERLSTLATLRSLMELAMTVADDVKKKPC